MSAKIAAITDEVVKALWQQDVPSFHRWLLKKLGRPPTKAIIGRTCERDEVPRQAVDIAGGSGGLEPMMQMLTDFELRIGTLNGQLDVFR